MPAIKKYIDLKLILLLAGFYSLFVGKTAYFRHHLPRGIEEPWRAILLQTIVIDWLVVVIYMSFIAKSTKGLLKGITPEKRLLSSTPSYPK